MRPTNLECSFCAKQNDEVQLLIEKPGAIICNECVTSFNAQMSQADCAHATTPHEECSFCSFMKAMPAGIFPDSSLGYRLIRTEKACICDECLDICNEVLSDHGICSG
jgi:ATP-dependent protease Clp ATPase subunit